MGYMAAAVSFAGLFVLGLLTWLVDYGKQLRMEML